MKPRTHKLLDAYREHGDLPPERVDVLLRELSERVEAGAQPSPELNLAPPALPSSAPLLWLVKPLLTLGLIAAASFGAWQWSSAHEVELPPPMPASARMQSAPTNTSPVVAQIAPPPEDAPLPSADRSSPSLPQPKRARSVPSARKGGSLTASSAPAPTPAALAQGAASGDMEAELRLLQEARQLLREHQPRAALAVLSSHQERFPRGQLADSREVTRILALCEIGDGERARAEAASFLQAHPGSPFAGRVRSACAPK